MDSDIRIMYEEFQKLKEGDRRTTKWLMRNVNNNDVNGLHKGFLKYCEEHGDYFPDYSKVKGRIVGLPYHLPFIKTKKDIFGEKNNEKIKNGLV